MNDLQWVGVGFTAATLLFMMLIVWFDNKNLDLQRYKIVQFIASMSAGFGGGFFSGGVQVQSNTTFGGTEIAITAASGFVLFWVTRGIFNTTALRGEDYHLSIPAGKTLKAIVEAMMRQNNGTADFSSSFSSDELDAELNPAELHDRSLKHVIEKLPRLTKKPIRGIAVSIKGNNHFTLTPVGAQPETRQAS